MSWLLAQCVIQPPASASGTSRSRSGGQRRHGGPLGRDAADLHVGEGAASLAAAVGPGGRGRGDDVLEPVQRDDEQRQQEGQQAQEEPHVDVDVALASRRGGGGPRGRRGGREAEEAAVVGGGDPRLVLLHQRSVHARHAACWFGTDRAEEGFSETNRRENTTTQSSTASPVQLHVGASQARKRDLVWQRLVFSLQDS